MLEQGINVDHATLNRCVLKYPPIMKEAANYKRKITAFSWRVDETYIKVKGSGCYSYRAIDKYAATLDFMLSAPDYAGTATRFLKKR